MLELNEFQDPHTAPLDERRLGKYFRTGWQTFKQYPLGFLAFSLIILLVRLSTIFLSQKIYLIGLFLGIASYPLYVGDYIVSAKLLQKQPCAFADFFSGFHYYQPLIIYGFILGLFGGIDYFFQAHLALRLVGKLIFFTFTILYLFTPLIIVDRRLTLWQAMEFGRQTVQRRLFAIFVFVLSMFFILLAGIIALVIGIRVALPLSSCSTAAILMALPLVLGGAIAILVALPVFAGATTAAYADLFGLQSKEY